MYVYNYYNYYNCFQGGTPKAFLISEISLQDGTQVEGSKQSENKEEKSAATKKVLKKVRIYFLQTIQYSPHINLYYITVTKPSEAR